MRSPCGRFLHAAWDALVRLGFRFRGKRAAHRDRADAVGCFSPCDHGLLLRVAAPCLRGLPLFYRATQESNVNPEPFLQLDRVIHEKGRLAIMSLLAATPQLSFTEMKGTLSMTDGNLTAHVRTLQEAGYASVTKE